MAELRMLSWGAELVPASTTILHPSARASSMNSLTPAGRGRCFRVHVDVCVYERGREREGQGWESGRRELPLPVHG